MRIAIDISQIVYGTGVSHYTKKLVENLLMIDKKNEYVLFGGSLRARGKLKEFMSSLEGNFTGKIFPIPPRAAAFVWNRTRIMPIDRLLGGIDVFHSSDWSQPPSSAFKVTTVHDLAPIKFPKLVHKRFHETHKSRLKVVKKEVDRVIVPSDATGEDLKKYGLKEEKIRVIPEASSYSKVSHAEVEAVKKKYAINSDYLFSVGVSLIKNTERIMKAFDTIKAESALKLVVAGRPINISPKEERGIRFLGHIPDEDMPALYTGAEALVFPSLYEGFGLPILDAFSCGTPVVTSDVSSMPEVAGDAAVLVDPKSVGSIIEGVRTVLKQKKKWEEKAEKRARQFSWEETAKKTLDVYNESLI